MYFLDASSTTGKSKEKKENTMAGIRIKDNFNFDWVRTKIKPQIEGTNNSAVTVKELHLFSFCISEEGNQVGCCCCLLLATTAAAAVSVVVIASAAAAAAVSVVLCLCCC